MRKEERGITLLALIITIIILVILALITIGAAYTSGIIQFGVNGAKDYAKAALDENKVMTETESYMSSVVEEIHRLMNNESKSEDEELPELQIGDYVDYHPTDTTYVAKGQITGYDESNTSAEVGVTDQTLSTDTDVGWRVYKKDKDNLYLISASTVNSPFNLEGADGYNNAVYVLNEACKTMYGSTKYNATARSIKIEDIEEVSNYDKNTYNGYGTTNEYSEGYPNIFAYEKGQKVDGKEEGTLGASEQDEIYSGKAAQTNIEAKNTSYTYELSSEYMDEKYANVLSTNNEYWIASRCCESLVGSRGTYLCCEVFSGDNKRLAGSALFYGRAAGPSEPAGALSGLRPIVTVPLSSVTIGASGTGKVDAPYSLDVTK